jgi:serine/threonine protein kinase
MSILIHDPFNLLDDPALTFLAPALDPLQAEEQFRACLSFRNQPIQRLDLQAIRVIRHKPRRRCLIEYEVAIKQAERQHTLTWIAKVRSKGLDQASYHLQNLLWQNGFAADSPDQISVPEPVGMIPSWRMWLQCKAPGIPATIALPTTTSADLVYQIAQAIHKLHQANVPTKRQHSITDELAILHDRLSQVAHQKPQWQDRLERILAACDRLAAMIPPPQPSGIHRDLYPDQVLVDGTRLYLLDFDLLTRGDPGLDIGNFNGHLIEQGIREFNHPDALAIQQTALTEQFVQLRGEQTRPAIEAYTTLTLVRHIYLSTQFLDRQSTTAAILDHCERRLDPLTLLHI